MIPLPPGCKRAYEITFKVKSLTNEIGEWFLLQGGEAWAEEEYDWRGRLELHKIVKYGRAKPSYVTKDGTGLTLVRFAGEDASTASVFLIKFYDSIIDHNFKDYLNYD